MALVLETNYAKKLGLPGYSSHQFSVTVRQEINTEADVPETVARMYTTLQDSVDREIQKIGWLPQNGNGQPSANGGNANGNGRHAPVEADPAWACSIKQKRLIERVCGEQALKPEDLAYLAQQRYGKEPNELNKLEASGLIDELLEGGRGTTRRPPQPAGRAR